MADTGPSKLPGIPRLQTPDTQLSAWAMSVQEHLETRNGGRGNPLEKAATLRDIQNLNSTVNYLTAAKTPQSGEAVVNFGGGLSATVAIDKFIQSIKDTALYRNLMKGLDDPTRFDGIVEQVRLVLLDDLVAQAKKNQAAINSTQVILQGQLQSLAMQVNTLTASLGDTQSAVRDVSWASATATGAQAGKVTQLISSVGNYYQDGSPGRASLEVAMSTNATQIGGLQSQYTVKVQAGGVMTGFGLASTLVNGTPTSAFIIAANKFAIVDPFTYSGGLTNTPDTANVPFGVDSAGIYLNNNVYIRGNIRVDTGGLTLIDGLRGSLNIQTSGAYWDDNVARYAIWWALGNGGYPSTNKHLVIGDTVTISNGSFIQAKQWMGYSWQVPGVSINGSLLVNGSVSASAIDTRGLTIRDVYGNVILGSGVGLSTSYITGLGSLATQSTVSNTQVTGLGSLATQSTVSNTQVTGLGSLATQSTVSNTQVTGLGSLATQNTVNAGQVTGLGSLATANYVSVGSNVRFPDGSTMSTTSFINALNKIDGSNISTFMNSAAIGTAYIGSAAVGTLQIADNAVTIPWSIADAGTPVVIASGGEYYASAWFPLSAGFDVMMVGMVSYNATAGDAPANASLSVNVYIDEPYGHSIIFSEVTIKSYSQTSGSGVGRMPVTPGAHELGVWFRNPSPYPVTLGRWGAVVLGTMR